MNRPSVDLVVSQPGHRSVAVRRRSSPAVVALGVMTLAVAVAASYLMHRQQQMFLGELDAEALTQAGQIFARSVEQQRRYAQSAVSVLADDTRIRAPAVSPTIDEATVKDVLEDLQKASGASMLAVLDAGGKVRTVVGAQGLRELDLGGSAVVKTALERPSTVVWAFPERVLVVGVAPVRAAGRVAALLVMGFEIGEPLFGAIQSAVRVAGALLIGDRVVTSSVSDAATLHAFRAAREMENDQEQVIPGEKEFVARVNRTSDSAAAGKVVWLVPRHHEIGPLGVLRFMSWTPALLVALTFVLLLLARRRGTSER